NTPGARVSEPLRYLYAIADARAAPLVGARELRGIEGAPVEPLVEGPLLAAISVVPASDYEEGPLNEHLQNMDWLTPRAAVHQDVNSRLLEMTGGARRKDRKSTRLNSSHEWISYAVFCLKKNKKNEKHASGSGLQAAASQTKV